MSCTAFLPPDLSGVRWTYLPAAKSSLAWPESLWHVVAGRLARAARLHVVQNPVRSDHPSCQSHQHQAGALPGAMPKLQGDQRASKPLAGGRRESG